MTELLNQETPNTEKEASPAAPAAAPAPETAKSEAAKPETAQPAAEDAPAVQPRLPRPAPRKWKWGDRPEGHIVRTNEVISKMMPFIMKDRCDACNTYADEFDVTEADALCREMVKKGFVNFSFLHILLAAYVRTVSQRPQINRFVSGQRVYARNNIEVVMTVKKEMSLSSPETCIKVYFEPDDTLEEVYGKFNSVVESVKSTSELDSDFDKVAGGLAALPRPILRGVMRLLFWLDYHGWLPKSLLQVSPFHGSMIVTSMGSLGIKPIYHHIYNFGNLPIFISYGSKRTVTRIRRDGTSEPRRLIDVKVVTDERICDGFYYASAFKLIRRLIEHPRVLFNRPDSIVDDVD